MKSLSWKDVAELIGIAAIVASLVFVGLQMRQTQEIAFAEMGWSHLVAEIESRSAIYDFPDVWAKGNAGEELTPSESVIYETLILDFNSLQFYRAMNLVALTGDESEAQVVFADVAGFLHENPGARREWELLRAKFRRYRSLRGQPNYSNMFEQGVRAQLAAKEELQ